MGSAATPRIRVEHLVKSYPLFFRRRERLQALLGLRAGLHAKTALDNVSFEVRAGEAFGIVGENGSGKSTLLRIVAGISRPDGGTVEVSGTVAAILELGLGFHPDFTGRENALLYGSLLGVPPATMLQRMDGILRFAELGEFADQPLRTYSSGMAARLAFAAATAVEPAVLVVDEALAVGDGAFQKKCVDRMIELKEAGRTILFCSHSLYLVTSFCERALWLQEGKVAALGEAREVVEAYERYLAKKRQRESSHTAYQAATERTGLRPRLVRFSTEPSVGRWEPGQPLQLVLELEVPQGSPPYHLGASLDAMDERCVFFTATHWEQMPPLTASGQLEVRLELGDLPLGNGQFWVNGFIFDDTGMVVWDRARLATPLRVPGNRWDPSLVRIPHRWRLP